MMPWNTHLQKKKVWKERTRCQFFFSHCLSSPFVFFQLLNIKPLFTFPLLFQKQVCLYKTIYNTLEKHHENMATFLLHCTITTGHVFHLCCCISCNMCKVFGHSKADSKVLKDTTSGVSSKKERAKGQKEPSKVNASWPKWMGEFQGFHCFYPSFGGGMLTAMKGWISLPSKKAFGICWDSASTSWSILRTHKQPAFWRSVRIQFLESQRILVLHSWVTSCFIACWFQLSQNRWTFTMKILKIKLHT